MKTAMLYITVADAKEARKIAAALVDERLVACANIIDHIYSVYRWQGKVEKGAEALLTAKTNSRW